VREPEAARVDLRDIKGQESAKRALEVAAAGGHNLLMVGPPGAGKSMLAARLPTILPPLTPAELLEVSMVGSVAGVLEGGALTDQRPFRSPHHSASMPALVGGACAQNRAKSRSRITASCSWPNFRNSTHRCSIRCDSRSRAARL